jgi:hypothetical protein
VRSVQEEVKSCCLLSLEGCRGRLGELVVKGGRGVLQADLSDFGVREE